MRILSGKFYQLKSLSIAAFLIQGDVLTEENEDVEAVEASEGNSGFFIKHGTFMGTEREQMDSQASDMASCDSDYDTDLETEGNREKINILIRRRISYRLCSLIISSLI